MTVRGEIPQQDQTLFMREALREAEQVLVDGEVPVGAVIVMQGRIIGRGGNRVIEKRDPTAHAEIVALRQAARRIGNYRLVGADLYVTIEPCVMCAGAIIQARIERLFYGAPDSHAGAVDSLYKLLGDDRLNHRVEVTAGILEEESRALMKSFFQEKR
ncbi:MAG: tRNA adenosine(34) deaminase TadA [Deltaproteobacteria bacterium]|nr:tRNA adenosine(34) deaminase TadA [Candidatus Zymogenaceae bacterium]